MMVSDTYYVRDMGKYITEEENSMNYIFNPDQKDNYYDQTSECAVFEKKTGRKINLEECFVKGFDYKNAIIDIINKNQNYNKKTKQQILDIIDLNNYTINSDGINISEIKSKDGDYLNSFYISYIDFGYENLTVFE